MTEVATINLDDSHIDSILELLIQGVHYREIANQYNTSLFSLFKYLHCEKHSARVKEAREYAAHILVDKAELLLAQAKDNPSWMMAARELAHHYRWKASMIYGRQYAQKKVEIPQESEKKTITIHVREE